MVDMKNRWWWAALVLALLPVVAAAGADSAGLGRVGYAIQVGAFSEPYNAEALTDKLQQRGLDAFFFKNEKGFYAVRCGDFPSREDAQERARKLAEEGVIGAFFITLPSQASVAGVAPAPIPPTSPGTEAPPAEDLGFIAARTAERFIGIPYRWGGNNVVEGLDCSGFSRAVYYLVGVTIPRTAGEQFKVGRAVEERNLRDGDLVFFRDPAGKICHVGIYVGRGRFVHAPRRGQDIMISDLKEVSPTRPFAGARRYTSPARH